MCVIYGGWHSISELKESIGELEDTISDLKSDNLALKVAAQDLLDNRTTRVLILGTKVRTVVPGEQEGSEPHIYI